MLRPDPWAYAVDGDLASGAIGENAKKAKGEKNCTHSQTTFEGIERMRRVIKAIKEALHYALYDLGRLVGIGTSVTY